MKFSGTIQTQTKINENFFNSTKVFFWGTLGLFTTLETFLTKFFIFIGRHIVKKNYPDIKLSTRFWQINTT